MCSIGLTKLGVKIAGTVMTACRPCICGGWGTLRGSTSDINMNSLHLFFCEFFPELAHEGEMWDAKCDFRAWFTLYFLCCVYYLVRSGLVLMRYECTWKWNWSIYLWCSATVICRQVYVFLLFKKHPLCDAFVAIIRNTVILTHWPLGDLNFIFGR